MKISFYFVYNKPIWKAWRGYSSAIFLDLGKKITPMNSQQSEKAEWSISLASCPWEIYQGDTLIIDYNSDPEVIDDFIPKLEGLKIEEIRFDTPSQSWVIQLNDGTQIMTSLNFDDEKCAIIGVSQSYLLLSSGKIAIEQPTDKQLS